MFLAITDSGLGGLSICAALESRLRTTPLLEPLRITYINAWPDQQHGYNSLPGTTDGARIFDDALDAISALAPDRLALACNTLSVLYPQTRFSRVATFPVTGIIDAGVDLFREALTREPQSNLVLLGTRTTIASGVHRARLVADGFTSHRIVGVPCHGLATAIERDFGGDSVGELIATCASAVREAIPDRNPLLVGLCCTHYGYVGHRIAQTISAVTGRHTQLVNPNTRLVEVLAEAAAPPLHEPGVVEPIRVKVISKVALDDRTREGMYRLLKAVSPATALALSSYTHQPSLF